ncbi:cytochrome d ubiquinol oxidase subunit II [Halobacteriovorax sp. JY17]|uniref:cytochrome d ubiquinol oxidase subunit II n=1 Tax=Halobacteriovorax sp. JY17 TaxID=2014617 RepID=UPI000C61C46D|nr:cytochrome d ubiquinol oxidase subunit II [Halobacteriovorax sp. JY17]PIK16426.1 MAG: cytochrome d ubiquinol oxidase subunit II [Halobacteriovorax sp. JY17]
MEVFWFIIIALVLVMFFILDGYDFGAGIIHLFFAKEEKDKLVIAKSAGLFWDSNEVWLVAAGGLLFMAFPTFYASVFSGFYLPLMIALWLIIFRATGLEFRNQFKLQVWKDFWDKAFGVSSLLLSLIFGVGLGNIVRGVNFGGVIDGVSSHEPQYFFLPFFNSSFSPLSTEPGIFDWFTIMIGFISTITLAIHGANWIILKTRSSINQKLKSIIIKLNIVLLVLSVAALLTLSSIKSLPIENFTSYPILCIFPLIYIGTLVGLFFTKKFKKETTAFILSSLMIFSGLSTTLLSHFPTLLPSTNEHNPPLTIYNTSTTQYPLSVAIYWGIIGIILMGIYMLIQKRLLTGKIDDFNYDH